jgi:hypothetical protein
MISDLVRIVRAGPEDAAALFQLQKEAYASEGRLYPYLIPPLTETEAETAADIARSFVLKAVTADGGLVGSVRAVCTPPDTCQIRRDGAAGYRGRGIGSRFCAPSRPLSRTASPLVYGHAQPRTQPPVPGSGLHGGSGSTNSRS